MTYVYMETNKIYGEINISEFYKILQGSAVTLTMLGGLTIHPLVANFPPCIYIYMHIAESW